MITNILIRQSLRLGKPHSPSFLYLRHLGSKVTATSGSLTVIMCLNLVTLASELQGTLKKLSTQASSNNGGQQWLLSTIASTES